MPEYHYTARDSTGKSVTGKRTARSEEDLARQLQLDLLIPIEISEMKTSPVKEMQKPMRSKLFKPKVSQEDLQMFCRQMYTVLKAGIPIGAAISKMSESMLDKALANALNRIYQSLNEGKNLHVSLGQFPDIFNDFFINLVKVGETSGQLPTIFLHLSEYISLEVETRKKIKTALRYPITVFIATIVAILIINVFVIPSFAMLFERFHGELPFLTRVLITTSHFITNYWYIIIGLSMLLVYGFRYYVHTKKGELRWARMILKFPIIGWLIHRIILARFARLFALAFRSGLTVVESIDLVGASTGNAYVAQKILQVSEFVRRGNTITSSISKTELFPPLVIQMIMLGEETGSIDTLLDDIADFYQREINYDLARLSEAIEPIMLLIMGGIVLVLALGVFLPMWDMAQQIQSHH